MISVLVALIVSTAQPRMIPPNQRGPVRPPEPCMCAAPDVDLIVPVAIPAPVNGDWLLIECWVRYSLCMDDLRRDYREATRRGRVSCEDLVVWLQDAVIRRNACEQAYRQCAAAGGAR